MLYSKYSQSSGFIEYIVLNKVQLKISGEKVLRDWLSKLNEYDLTQTCPMIWELRIERQICNLVSLQLHKIFSFNLPGFVALITYAQTCHNIHT
jgi:hypothetical protein